MKNFLSLSRFLLFITFVLSTVASAIAAPGDLDQSFNPNSALPSGTIVQEMIVQPDGKVLVACFITNQFSLLRLNQDGSLDNSFNASGIFPNAERLNTFALQPDGRILVSTSTSGGGPIDPKLTRLNPNGSIDTSFSISGANNDIVDIAVQADGKILVSGNFSSYQGNSARLRIARLNANGSLDNSFNAGDIPVNGTYGISKMAVQPDGKIIVSGDFFRIAGVDRTTIARLNSNGSIDTSFNPGFGISGATNRIVKSIVIQSDGKIIIGGDFTNYDTGLRRGIARINTNGSLDNSFNAGFPSNAYQISDVALQPDGKIIVGSENAFVVRLKSDGSRDNSFVTAVNSTVNSVTLQASGKIVISGIFSTINGIPRNGIGRLLGDSAIPNRASFDFDGDSKTDIGIFRPSGGEWWINRSSSNQTAALQFGQSSDKLVPADFTGDGKTDFAVWRESSGQWFILRSEDNSFYGFPFGSSGDIPAPADFDGDGKADVAVFRPSNAVWYIQRSLDNQVSIVQFGVSEDKPVAADYDGDSKADIAIFRPSASEWWILKSSGGIRAVQFGSSGDKAVAGDYTGDGKADIAFWRASNGFWYILRSEDDSFYSFPFGLSDDAPAPGDYDGDGKFDAAVFRPSNAVWYLSRSTAGFLGVQFGLSTDQPIPNAFVR